MDMPTIGVEEWLNVWERSATTDIAQSTIASLTMAELRALDGADGAEFYELLDRETMNYGWIEGSLPRSSTRSRASIGKTSTQPTSSRPMAAPGQT